MAESLVDPSYNGPAELAASTQTTGQIASTVTVYNHAVCIAGIKTLGGTNTAPFVDFPLNGVGITQQMGLTTSGAA